MSNDIRRVVIAELSGWPSVRIDETDPDHPQFHVGKIELGHLHGATVAHLPFPRRLRDSLIASGHVTPHPMFPKSGWVERRITGPDDLIKVIDLFRMNYDRAQPRDTQYEESQQLGDVTPDVNHEAEPFGRDGSATPAVCRRSDLRRARTAARPGGSAGGSHG